ncbi:hypothetical protein IscW_ISCW001416 [Ixodes scapularis]|uniref:Uncharacterized protein n=1 Tax=Ixodes scapularis TaxID=6945 RepID=B7P0K5_IXOSC|nr:hypothetical protein IscW_ISCW001416 [Ixodes scapularis]|eukprot:XP_002399199.1 hypothetical protein IscW_ISCW001416 [Ixodes scapularis]
MALGLYKIIEKIAKKVVPIYLPQPTVTPEAEVYEREEADPADQINSDFTEWEMEATISKERTESKPEPEFVSGHMLQNLPEGATIQLLKLINDVSRRGELPAKW